MIRKSNYKKDNVVIDTEFVESVDIKQKDIFIEKKDNVNKTGVIFLIIILSLISGFLGSYLVKINNFSYTTTNNNGIIRSSSKLEETNTISSSVEKIYDAVVVVEVYQDDKLISTGTGFVYEKKEDKVFLMTNNHVISTEGKIKVLFTNGAELDAEIVGSDVYSDIAVLSVKGNDKIVSATLGKSVDSKIGDTVFTVGSPEGSDYAGTVTKGIISAKDRVVEVALSNSESYDYYMDVLQTDAAINPGNSGGPICNINGEVIGITNMKLVDDTVEGMGFAIPIEDALEVAEILEKSGKVTRPYVGVEILDLSNEFNLWKAGILIPEGVNGGVVVYNVVSNSPADEAGLEKGDIIIKLGDKEIKNLADFRYELYKYEPGDEVLVVYNRDGKEEKTSLKLGDGE